MDQLETLTPLQTVPLTQKQMKYVGAISNGMNKNEALRAAGYSEKTNPTVLEKTSKNLRQALLASMEARGLTSDFLGRKIKQGIDAKKKVFSSYKGNIIETRVVADNETQHKYVRTALEIRGDLDSGMKQEINIGIVEVPGVARSSESWNEGV